MAEETTPRGAIESTDDRFVWSPPVAEWVRVARARLRTTSAVLVILAALWAGASVWNDGLDAVVFALIVPLMLIVIALAVDRLLNVGARLRLEVASGGLTITRGRVRQRIPHDDIRGVVVRSTAAGGGNRSGPAGWHVVIDRHDHEPISALVPVGLGGMFDRGEATLLEAELRRRCRV